MVQGLFVLAEGRGGARDARKQKDRMLYSASGLFSKSG
jgi:hypothetical protein